MEQLYSPFARLELVLIQLKLVLAENRRDSQSQLHLSDVTSHTSTRTIAEGDKGVLLAFGDFQPTIRIELVRILTPNLLGVVAGLSISMVIAEDGILRFAYIVYAGTETTEPAGK